MTTFGAAIIETIDEAEVRRRLSRCYLVLLKAAQRAEAQEEAASANTPVGQTAPAAGEPQPGSANA